MPVTRRGSTSTPVQACIKASLPSQQKTSHSHTLTASGLPEDASLRSHQQQRNTKRKASTISSPHKEGALGSPTKSQRRQQKSACEQSENSAPAKRHRVTLAGDDNGNNAIRASGVEVAVRSSSSGDIQPMEFQRVDSSIFQSPSRPPLVPRTPATADRAGRKAGKHIRLVLCVKGFCSWTGSYHCFNHRTIKTLMMAGAILYALRDGYTLASDM